MPDIFLMTIRNDLHEISRLAEQIEIFCDRLGVFDNDVFQINLVLDELITNLISYGYSDSSSHEIHIGLAPEKNRMKITMTDDGLAFNPLHDSPPVDIVSALEKRKAGGLGLHFLQQMMDGFEYQRLDNMNQLIMFKNINQQSTGKL